jgi:DNA-directed RNA polymerase subunit M/transcription elongation factor TFIIS
MADYEKLRNKRSCIHGRFAETMAEDMKTSSTHTYPLMLYLHGFLEMDQSLLDTCLSYLPSDVFSQSTSRLPRLEPKNKSGGRYQRPGGKGGKSSTENGMQSQVLASLSAKNNVLAYAAAAEAGASTMNNKQHQRDRKRNLMKEFVDEIGRGSFGKAEAKERIKKYKKKKGKDGAPTDDEDSIIEPDSQESLIESIVECEECIANLESIHVQQRRLLDSTLFDANRIGMN